VLRARELGFSSMKSGSSCVSSTSATGFVPKHGTSPPVHLADVHLADVRAKIADLKRMERVLKDVVAQCGAGTPPECPLIDMLFGKSAVN
jgi:MerR family mercuric resistance operon transcriptional regulator